MILGFLGKGGSGKSTLATHFIKHLHKKGVSVLAVDADHNMDLSYNLGQENTMNYIGQGNVDVLRHMEISSAREVLGTEKDTYFSLSPLDPVTEKYTTLKKDNLRLMVAGPHTEAMMYGSSCSHGLTQPLRTYLPFLKLTENEAVVVDEKAGADGVGTGITVGFTTAVIVAEATPHGIKAAKQIKDMLKFYNTPYVFVLNKVQDKNDIEKLEESLGEKAVIAISFDKSVATNKEEAVSELMEKLFNEVASIEDTRASRAKKRLKNLTEFEQSSR